MHQSRKLLGAALVAAFILLAWAAPAFAQDVDPEGTNPIALLLAESSGYSVEEINALSVSGASYGNIARALAYAEATGVSPAEALLLAEGVGWGQLFKEAEISPGGNGLGALVSAARRNEHANKDASCGDDADGADSDEAALTDLETELDQDCADDDTDDAEKGNNGNGNAFGHDKDNANGNGQGHGNAGGEGNGDNGNGNAFGHGKGKGDDGDDGDDE